MKNEIDRLMRENDLAALLVVGSTDHNPHMVYFTGGRQVSDADLIKPAGRKPVLYHFPMERDEAAASGLKTINYNKYHFMDLFKQAKGNEIRFRTLLYQKVFTDLGLIKGRILIYGRTDAGYAYELAKSIRKALPGIEIVGDVNEAVLPVAMLTKDADEISHIRSMGSITTGVVARTAEFLTSHKAKNGRLVKKDGQALTIGEVKRCINLWLAEAGVENPEGTIFSIGRDAAIGHTAGASGDELSLGKTIAFDIFPCEALGGFYYDFARTWCLGYAPDDVQQLYDDVKRVYDTVVSELRINGSCAQYQHRTCELFAARGHPTLEQDPQTIDGYYHSLGHGIGLNVHERPHFNFTSDDRLVKGSTFAIEPGLYYPEREMGVCIEDSYCVTPEGKIEILADYPYDLVLKIKGH